MYSDSNIDRNHGKQNDLIGFFRDGHKYLKHQFFFKCFDTDSIPPNEHIFTNPKWLPHGQYQHNSTNVTYVHNATWFSHPQLRQCVIHVQFNR